MSFNFESFLLYYTHNFSEDETRVIRGDLSRFVTKQGFGARGGSYPGWHPLNLLVDDLTRLKGNVFNVPPLDDFDKDHKVNFCGGFFIAPYRADTYDQVKSLLKAANGVAQEVFPFLEFKCKRIKKAYHANAYPLAIWVEDTDSAFKSITSNTPFVDDELANLFIDRYFQTYKEDLIKVFHDNNMCSMAEDLGFGYLSPAAQMYIFNKAYDLIRKN